MTLQEAIEIKLAWKKTNYEPPLADEINADNLSIEALKLIIKYRPAYLVNIPPLLPGETKE